MDRLGLDRFFNNPRDGTPASSVRDASIDRTLRQDFSDPSPSPVRSRSHRVSPRRSFLQLGRPPRYVERNEYLQPHSVCRLLQCDTTHGHTREPQSPIAARRLNGASPGEPAQPCARRAEVSGKPDVPRFRLPTRTHCHRNVLSRAGSSPQRRSDRGRQNDAVREESAPSEQPSAFHRLDAT